MSLRSSTAEDALLGGARIGRPSAGSPLEIVAVSSEE